LSYMTLSIEVPCVHLMSIFHWLCHFIGHVQV
jgi:hypothetical protein